MNRKVSILFACLVVIAAGIYSSPFGIGQDALFDPVSAGHDDVLGDDSAGLDDLVDDPLLAEPAGAPGNTFDELDAATSDDIFPFEADPFADPPDVSRSRSRGAGADTSEQKKQARLAMGDAKYEAQARALLTQYRRTKDIGKKNELKDRLNKVLQSQFSVRQQMQEMEIVRIEARIQQLRQRFDRRKREQSRIVQNRLEQLIRDADGLGWGEPAGVKGPNNDDLFSITPLPAN